MDYTEIPRDLIFYDRTSIDEFRIDDETWIDRDIFEQLLHLKCIDPARKETELLVLTIFNDAYYILTSAFLELHPVFRIEHYLNVAKSNSFYLVSTDKGCIVLSIVCGFLNRYDEYLSSDLRLLKEKMTEFYDEMNGWKESFIEFSQILYRTFDDAAYMFRPRKITWKVADEIDWIETTKNFDIGVIRDLVKNLGRSNEEKKVIISAIYHSEPASENMSEIPYEVNELLDKLYREVDENHKGLLKEYDPYQEGLNLDVVIENRIRKLKEESATNEDVDEMFDEKKAYDDQLKSKDAMISQLKEENEILRAQERQAKEQLSVMMEKNHIESDVIIAEDRKIDVIKILHSMCKTGLFKKKDETNINVQKLMEIFGRILNNNFSDYSSNLSASKAKTKEKTFLAIFDELKESERKYFNKS